MRRVWQSGAGIWLTVAMTTPAWAQSARKAEGWPTPPAAAIAETERGAAATPPGPATTVTPARRPATTAMARTAVAHDATPARTVNAQGAAPVATELLDVLQQQSALLSRLTAELNAQRALIAAQQAAIAALEARPATPPGAIALRSTPAPVGAPAPSAAPVITVETGGAKLDSAASCRAGTQPATV